LLSRGAQAAFDERRHEAATVGGVGVQIARRVDLFRGRRRRLPDQAIVDGVAVQQRLHPCQPMRARGGADHSDMRVARRPLPIFVIKQEDAGEGEITLTPGIFSEGPAPAARPWQMQLGDDLVRPAQRRQGPVKKSPARIGRDPAGPTRVISPSQVTATPGNSAAGSAWARLPPTVPRLRIW